MLRCIVAISMYVRERYPVKIQRSVLQLTYVTYPLQIEQNLLDQKVSIIFFHQELTLVCPEYTQIILVKHISY